MLRLRVMPILIALILALGVSQAFAQTFVALSGGGQGLYHVPNSGPISHIAFLVVHRTGDYLNHAATVQLPQRGFSILGVNTRFRNNEASVNWELIALDVRAGVRYLRSRPGITKVVLIGHSGGGPTTSYYKAVAEIGPSYCQGPNKLSPCLTSQLAGFTAADKADAIVFLDAHPGNPVNALRSLNAGVSSESNPKHLNAALDPFREKNGFNPDGDSVYTERFVRRYTNAQARRMNDLIEEALEIRKDIQNGKHAPTDNDAFVAYHDSARLSDFSNGVHCCTLQPAKLLKNNGSIDGSQIVRTVRVPNPGNREEDASFGGALFLNITSFLSANAIRSSNSLDGIDWCSSNNSTPCAVASLSPSLPILVMSMQGHYFIRDGEHIYESSASNDKDFVVVEGATHGLAACTACATFHGTGPYTNARTNMFDYIKNWVTPRLP